MESEREFLNELWTEIQAEATQPSDSIDEDLARQHDAFITGIGNTVKNRLAYLPSEENDGI